jgi:DNA-nicking Smr family endonuclease
MDARTAERLKRGRLVIEGRLDLHGLSQARAHPALAAFIERGYAEGRRCLLVITGKGGGKLVDAVPQGVLRAMVPQWLNAPELRAKIVSIMPAQPRHGGEGALYVLLKRHREPKS